jgi:hypothetical protein
MLQGSYIPEGVEDMATVMKFMQPSKPSLLTRLPEAERQKIERNAEAARERLKHGSEPENKGRLRSA